MKQMKNITYLLLPLLFVMQSCVKDEANIFDDTAAARGQKAVENYRALLANAENGWYVDYYPELDHKIGGYAMYWKFTADGKVTVQCEIKTNNPANTPDVSEFDVFMEQGPILSFNSYNKVLHYFSEASAADINGQEGDYEFIIMNAEPDQILLKGKKHGTKMLLRRNTDNVEPDTYLAEVATLANQAADALTLHLIMNSDDTIGAVTVTKRTFTIEYANAANPDVITYTFTNDGISLYEPFTVNGVTIQNFRWDNDQMQFVSIDAGTDVRLSAYFPEDFQLKYSEFLGKWKLVYTARRADMESSTGANLPWETSPSIATVNIVEQVYNESFLVQSDELFNFDGLILTFDPLKGTVAFYIANVGSIPDMEYTIRQCFLGDTKPSGGGYLQGGLNTKYGYVGIWNSDENDERVITFQDNGFWITRVIDSITLVPYDLSNTRRPAPGAYYRENVNNLVILRDLVLTKIND
jgi:hypothetical protein